MLQQKKMWTALCEGRCTRRVNAFYTSSIVHRAYTPSQYTYEFRCTIYPLLDHIIIDRTLDVNLNTAFSAQHLLPGIVGDQVAAIYNSLRADLVLMFGGLFRKDHLPGCPG